MPNSPRGLKPLLAGCTAIDLLNGADELVADVDDALDLARQKTLGVNGLKVVGRDLSAVMDLIEQGAIDVSDGDPCGGAATLGKGTRLLAQGKAPLPPCRSNSPSSRPWTGDDGDADGTDLQLAGVHYRQGLLGQAAGKVGEAAAGVRCDLRRPGSEGHPRWTRREDQGCRRADRAPRPASSSPWQARTTTPMTSGKADG